MVVTRWQNALSHSISRVAGNKLNISKTLSAAYIARHFYFIFKKKLRQYVFALFLHSVNKTGKRIGSSVGRAIHF